MMKKSVCLSCLMVMICIAVLHAASPAESAEGGNIIIGRDGGEMVLVPEGYFFMGSEGLNFPDDERPRHKVFVNAFYIDRHEVTTAQFASFLNDNPRAQDSDTRKRWVVIRDDLEDQLKEAWYPAEIMFQNGKYIAYKGFERAPVITVSWDAANDYCTWHAERLPTEAEWEKAARGGLEEKDYPWGSQLPTPDSGVVFGRRWKDNSVPSPVARVDHYPANGYGIFGMAGNVSEWCSDWYGADYYRHSPEKNPGGPSAGQRKVQRGGSWASNAVGLRVAARGSYQPAANSTGVGFRCARDAAGVRPPVPGS